MPWAEGDAPVKIPSPHALPRTRRVEDVRTASGLIRRIGFLLALATLPFAATAQSGYPAKPIRMIIPLAAASAVDNAARIVAQQMSVNMGEQIVIDNQPGAATHEQLAKYARLMKQAGVTIE
jgi:tripartite-type tricarboxylate transporter receptor subunit TctC